MKIIRVIFIAAMAAMLVMVAGCRRSPNENIEGEYADYYYEETSGVAVGMGLPIITLPASALPINSVPLYIEGFEDLRDNSDHISDFYVLNGMTLVGQVINPVRSNDNSTATSLINNDVGLGLFFAYAAVYGNTSGTMTARLEPRDWSGEDSFYFWARIREDAVGSQYVRVFLTSNGVDYMSEPIAITNVRSANGFYRVPFATFVTVDGNRAAAAANFNSVTSFTLQISGGSMWIDQIQVGSHPVPVVQPPILSDPRVQAAIPERIEVVGGLVNGEFHIEPETASLFAFLHGITGYYVLFGAQDANRAAALGGRNIQQRAVGAFPAVMSFDTFGRVFHELGGGDSAIVRQAFEEGAIITVCIHMRGLRPNEYIHSFGTFRHVVPGPNDTWVGTENMVTAILTEGTIERENMIRFFDELAEWAKTLVFDVCEETGREKLIPIILRPWHEQNGDWFWWGRGRCTPEEFVELWRWTVNSLRERGVTNFLYAFSPNTTFTRESYLDPWWPGDDYVDILGFDSYFDNISLQWPAYRDRLIIHNQIVLELAAERGKVAAITEFGLHGGTYHGSDHLDYYELVEFMIYHNALVPYMAIWRSNTYVGAYTPYRQSGWPGGTGDTRTGSAYTPQNPNLFRFIDFYNRPEVGFADRLQGILELQVIAEPVFIPPPVFASYMPLRKSVRAGTAELNLPVTISFISSDNEIAAVNVTWSETSYPAFDAGTFGSYTFTAASLANLPDWLYLPDTSAITLTVVVVNPTLPLLYDLEVFDPNDGRRTMWEIASNFDHTVSLTHPNRATQFVETDRFDGMYYIRMHWDSREVGSTAVPIDGSTNLATFMLNRDAYVYIAIDVRTNAASILGNVSAWEIIRPDVTLSNQVNPHIVHRRAFAVGDLVELGLQAVTNNMYFVFINEKV